MMRKVGYKFLEHTADVSVEVKGTTLEEAFEQTAYSLMETISPSAKFISPKVEKTFKIKAEDKEALLFDFLTEFLYIFDVEGLIFSEIKIHKISKEHNEFSLQVKAKGEQFNKSKHEPGTEVKAITYSYMKIEEKKNRVIINIVFDI
jgi:SHS2 domain-containing protein